LSGFVPGRHFDIHGGGQDLQFPHHENEIAQSEGAHQCQYVNYWMHNGFVRVDDEKMSKSLGNFFTIREVLKKYDAEVVRFFILRAHYRSPLNYSDVHLDDARQALTRLYTALKGASGEAAVDWNEPHAVRFKAAPEGGMSNEEIAAIVGARGAAKMARNFAESDRIRDELKAAGVVLEDGPQGTTWRRA
jgi:cysteinyl-tRNA synthetase